MRCQEIARKALNHFLKMCSTDDQPLSSDDEGSTGKDRASEGKSMFSMFSFMKRQNPPNSNTTDSAPGIYLDDLNLDSMDAETTALYFPSIMKEVSHKKLLLATLTDTLCI